MPRILFSICVFFSCAQFVAQQYAFRELSLKKGLPQSQVKAINQDAAGFLWVGTLGGLARFDGKRFDVFTIEQGLLNNRITCIEFVGDRLIVGHENGVSEMITPGWFKAIPIDRFSDKSKVSDVVQFENRVLVATNGSGLFELKDKQLHPLKVTIPDDDALEEFQRVRKMAVYKNKLFFATRGGIYHTTNLKDYHLIAQTIDWSVSDMHASNSGLFVSTYNEDTYYLAWNEDDAISFQTVFTTESAEIHFHQNGHNGSVQLWVLTEFNTILRRKYNLSESEMTADYDLNLNQGSGLPTESITTIFVDANGVLWVGTEGKGLFQFMGEAFAKHKVDAPVLSILKDDKKNQWLGTLNGGLKLKGTKSIDTPKGLNDNSVWCALKDKNGSLWFGTNKGLFIFQNEKWLLWNSENQNLLPDSKISALHEDANGDIWIGTRRGIAYAKNYELQALPIAGAHNLQIVRDLCTHQDQLVIATKTNLYRLDKKTYKLYAVEMNNLKPSFSCLFVDKQNTLWIGTEEGLFIFSDNQLKSIGYTTNSAEKFINFIVGMENDVVVGTNKGVFQFSDFEADLRDFNIRHFDDAHGLTGTETNIKSAFYERGSRGKLWFGTSEGLFLYEPKKLNAALNDYRPKLFLTDFQVNFNSFSTVSLTEGLQLKYNQNRLRFIFQTLDLYYADKVALEYRLDTREDWSRVGSDAEIVFNQLASGRYKMQVRALGGNGNYSDILQFQFTILQPFYASWWFTLLLLLTMGLITFGLVRYRIQQIRTQETQERLELNNRLNTLEQQSLNASMNRHFIFNALNSIQYFINTQDKLSANKYLSKFAQLIRKNLDSSASGENKVTLAEEIQRLQLYLSLESMRFDGRFEFTFALDEDIELEEIKIPPMLFQPFIENSIIHGILPNEKLEGKIIFSAVQNENEVVFTITDNGVGYSTSLKGKKGRGDHFSHGTNITKSRIEVIRKISGDVISMDGPNDLTDENGNVCGTRVVIRIK